MSWFGWGGSSSDSSVSTPDAPLDMSGGSYNDLNSGTTFGSFGSFGAPESSAPTSSHEAQDHSVFASPVLALDQLKSAGVPVTRQMTPYLQMDPSMFIQSQPQYIMPEGGSVNGKGKFEFALGHIGWAVGGGFVAGSVRGAFGELINPETRKMIGKPWMTRIVNATVKHGSGFAQPAGAIVFLYSALEIGFRSVRAEDDLNGIGAGALTGALYRSPHGLRASGLGAATGVLLAAAWVLVNPESRSRVSEMFS